MEFTPVSKAEVFASLKMLKIQMEREHGCPNKEAALDTIVGEGRGAFWESCNDLDIGPSQRL